MTGTRATLTLTLAALSWLACCSQVSVEHAAAGTTAGLGGTGGGSTGVTSSASGTGGSVPCAPGSCSCGGTVGLPLRPELLGFAPSQVILAGDRNGDGHADLVVANGGDIDVLLGKGDGTFAPPIAHPTGAATEPDGWLSADVDGDSVIDVITTHDDDVWVLRGDAGGGFGSPIRSGTANAPLFSGAATLPVAADVNGDGKLDLVVAAAGALVTAHGKGDGTFVVAASTAVGFTPNALALADVNGDGRPDVLATGDTYSLHVLLAGPGGLAPAVDYATTPNPIAVSGASDAFSDAVTVADVNGDGRLDAVVANAREKSVSVLLGEGDGTFAPWQEYPTTQRPRAILAVDVDGDGKLDLAVVESRITSGVVGVLRGAGDGTFGPGIDVPCVDAPRSIRAADLNEDGKLDLVVGSGKVAIYDEQPGTSVALLLGGGDGTFVGGRRLSDAPAWATVVGDVNGDGKPDLVTSAFQGVEVRLGDGAGGFSAPITSAEDAQPWELSLGDMNGDGKLDLVAVDQTFQLVVLLGDGQGAFATHASLPNPLESGAVESPVLADLDGDGHLDVAWGADLGTAVPITFGNGDGTLSAVQFLPVPEIPSVVALADTNGDGLLDIVGGGAVLLGEGAGTFAPPIPHAGGEGPIAVGDLNGDGNLDLVVAQLAGNAPIDGVAVLLGDGTGAFGAPLKLALPGLTSGIVIADLNGDGRPDLIVERPASIAVVPGNGDGSFGPPAVFPAAAGFTPLLGVADLDADGRLDLVVTGSWVPGISVLLNGCF